MANVRNFNARNYDPSNEGHEDGRCDPDVEARLYAEIYYSNETYPDYNVNSANTNSIPSSSNQHPPFIPLDPSNMNQNERRRRDQFHWAIDTRPGQDHNSNPPMYSINRETVGTANIEPTVEPYSKATGMFRKPYRALTDGFNPPHGYPPPLIPNRESIPRLPRHNNNRFEYDERSPRTSRQQFNPANRSYLRLEHPKSDRWRPQHVEKFQKQKELNRIERKEKQHRRQGNLQRNPMSRRQKASRNLQEEVFVEDRLSDEELGRMSFAPLNELIEVRPEAAVQNSSEGSASQPTIVDEGTTNINTEVSAEQTVVESEVPVTIQDTRNESERTTNPPTQNAEDISNSRTSKYNVSEKSTTRNEPVAEEDDLSESDESIFEVPVPPKPIPPLINLRDSDDEDSSSEEEESPVVMTRKSPTPIVTPDPDSSSGDSSSCNSPVSAPASVSIEPAEETTSAEPEITENIVLNCTQLQKGVSTLEEIRQMRESTSTNNVHDDEDSMTESEAMNWVSVDVEMINQKAAQRRNEPGIDVEHWQNFQSPVPSVENLETSTISSNVVIEEAIPSTSREESVPEDQLTVIEIPSVTHEVGEIAERVNIPSQVQLVHPDDRMGPPTIPAERRKRSCAPENNPEPDVSMRRPEKRQKQTDNPRANMSFEEYIFQPMPKQLITFYNRPQSAAIREVSEIQSRMPRDPSRWAILDVDMLGSRRRGYGKVCAFCHREGHRRDQCSERPRTVVCKMCGNHGHNEPRCPSTMCLTCGRKFSSYRKTCEYCNRLRCSTCGGAGHDKSGCPDLWRKYHLTTSGTNPRLPRDLNNIEKAPRYLSCCNCARRGHDFASCNAYRWSGHFVTPSYVTNYEKGPCYIPDEQPLQQRPTISTPTNEISANSTTDINTQIITPKPPEILSRLSATPLRTPEVPAPSREVPDRLLNNPTGLPEISAKPSENPAGLPEIPTGPSEFATKSFDIVSKLREIAAQPQMVISQIKDIVANNSGIGSNVQDIVPIAETVVRAIHSLIQQPQQIENVLQRPQPKVIFQYAICSPEPGETWKSMIIDPQKCGVPYPHHSGVPARPEFLRKHVTSKACALEVIVNQYQDSERKIEIVLRTRDSEALVSLEILMLQWMGRNRADRKIHCEAPTLPFDKDLLFQMMLTKLQKFAQLTTKNGYTHVLSLKVKSSEAKQVSFSIKNKPSNGTVTKSLDKIYDKMNKSKEILVACVYNYQLDSNGRRLIRELEGLMDQLKDKTTGNEPSCALFLGILWYNFELFTGHISPNIRGATAHWCNLVEWNRHNSAKKRKIKLSPIIKDSSQKITQKERRKLKKEARKLLEEQKKLNQSVSEPATEPISKKRNRRRKSKTNNEQPDVEIIQLDDNDHVAPQPLSVQSQVQTPNADVNKQNNSNLQCNSADVSHNEEPIHMRTRSRHLTSDLIISKNLAKKYGGVKVIINNFPPELRPKGDRRPLSSPLILKLALAALDYVRENDLPEMIKSAEKLVEQAKKLIATNDHIQGMWSRITIALKTRLSRGKDPGTIINYPEDVNAKTKFP